ncbi:transposase [Nocardia beijingensis]|uniref:transposase n=1 Tax=Nocardia beijingensis TaxID=95162 RepID=UPI00344B3123
MGVAGTTVAEVRGAGRRNFANNRRAVEGMLYRLRTGIPWQDLPEVYGPWLRLLGDTA